MFFWIPEFAIFDFLGARPAQPSYIIQGLRLAPETVQGLRLAPETVKGLRLAPETVQDLRPPPPSPQKKWGFLAGFSQNRPVFQM